MSDIGLKNSREEKIWRVQVLNIGQIFIEKNKKKRPKAFKSVIQFSKK